MKPKVNKAFENKYKESSEQVQGYGSMTEQQFKENFSNVDPNMEQPKNSIKPPKKGELIICQFCNKPIYPRASKFTQRTDIPEELFMNKNKSLAKREYEFHVHECCRAKQLDLLDMKTPGVYKERKELYEMLEEK